MALVDKIKDYVKHTQLYKLLPIYYGLPRQICIEVTNDCNLKCAKCPTYDAKRGRGYMSMEIYEKIMADIAKARGKTDISFTGGGEPTICEHLPKFIEIARKNRNVDKIRLVTNALDLTPMMTDAIIAAGLDEMNVSLDTTDAKVYAQINRVDGYDRVVANVDYLSQEARAKGVPINLKVTLYKDVPDQIAKMKASFESKFNSIRFTNMHNWLGLRGKQKEVKKPGPCIYPFYQVQILWDGQLTLCCQDSMEGFINMGNIKDIDLMEYWLGSTMQNTRDAHIKDDLKAFPVCETCDAHTYAFDKEIFRLN